MFEKILNSFISWFCSIGDKIIITIDLLSFQTCLLVGLVALILYVFGYKKGLRIATITPGVYVILQIFLEVWFGV